MRFLLFLLLGLFLMQSCSDRDDDVTEVFIRIKNESTLTFDTVQVGEQETLHTNIAPDEFSDYLPYVTAYRYAYIEITSGEETFVLQPIDFVGEEELPLGFYTYELDVSEEGVVSLNFEAD